MTAVPIAHVEQPAVSAELPMLDIYLPMMKSAAIIAAARLGVFEALATDDLEIGLLAGCTGTDEAGMRTLADFLVALGYLQRQGMRYGNTDYTRRWLTSHGAVNYTPGALWSHEAWSMMGQLDMVVKEGGPATNLWDRMTHAPHLGALFSRYMQAFAQDLGPDLLDHLPVDAAHRRLLDLGGSHGQHAMRFCQRYQQLEAVIVDLPSALTDTPAAIAAAGLSGRIQTRAGSVLDLDWGDGYDLVFYLSVGHNQHAEDNRRVIAQIARSLRPGGLLLVHDYLAQTPPNPFQAAFRLTLMSETGTRTYSEGEYRDWIEAAGFSGVSRVDLNPLEKGSLLIARR